MIISKESIFSNENYEEYYYQLKNLVGRNEYWRIFCDELHNHINCHPRDYEFAKMLNNISKEKACDLLSFFESSEFSYEPSMRTELSDGICPYFFKEPNHSRVFWEEKDEYNLISFSSDKEIGTKSFSYTVKFDSTKNKWFVISM